MSSIGSVQSYIPSIIPPDATATSSRIANDALAQNLSGVSLGGALNPATTAQQSGEIPASFSTIMGQANATQSAGTPEDSGLWHYVSEVDSKMQAADTEQGKLLTGESSNLHQSMITTQEASVAFSLMVEVRNKLVDSYQELMRMQV